MKKRTAVSFPGKTRQKYDVMNNPKVSMFLNSTSDYSIVDEHGAKYTPDEARDVVERGDLGDFNLSFKRLIDADFDVEKVKAYYKTAVRP